jgi:hypothetical protein
MTELMPISKSMKESAERIRNESHANLLKPNVFDLIRPNRRLGQVVTPTAIIQHQDYGIDIVRSLPKVKIC